MKCEHDKKVTKITNTIKKCDECGETVSTNHLSEPYEKEKEMEKRPVKTVTFIIKECYDCPWHTEMTIRHQCLKTLRAHHLKGIEGYNSPTIIPEWCPLEDKVKV